MSYVYIGIGSNIEPETNISAALRLMAERVTVLACSTFYRTDALDRPGYPPFYNGVVKVSTDISPRELKFEILRKIETDLSRTRGIDKYAPRTIDLDILIYEDMVVCEPDIIIPDPDIERREFIALPLLELSPSLVIPGSGKALSIIAEAMTGRSIEPLEKFSRSLREQLMV